jgi:hypothetical protein
MDVLYIKTDYLGGYEACDMAKNTRITLNYRSNILGDISKITTSSSLTIKLPKTTHNRRIFDNAAAPSYASRFRYRQHDCYITRNGVKVVEGYCVLLSSGADYSVSVVFGLGEALKALIKSDKSINELPDTLVTGWGAGSEQAFYVNVGWGYLDYRYAENESLPYHTLPVVSAKKIFDMITAEYGVAFSFGAEAIDLVRRLLIPCITADGTPYTWETLQASGNGTASYYGTFDDVPLQSLRMNSGASDPTGIIVTSGTYSTFLTKGAKEVYVETSRRVALIFPYDEEGQQIASPLQGLPSSGIIETDGWHSFRLVFEGYGTSTVSVIVRPYFEELPYPSEAYGVVGNLPDIKITEFIKAVCAMSGTFPVVTPQGAIHLYTLADSDTQDAEAYDWSDRLIASSDDIVDEIEVDSDLAQRLEFKYKEDEAVETTANGALLIDDTTLDPSKDYYTSPFSATDANGGGVKMYIVEGTSDDLTRITPSPRVWIHGDTGTEYGATFVGLRWSELLATYWREWEQQVFEQYVKIKVRARLSAVELRDVDYRKRVYLSQFGRYYLISTIQTQGDVATLELIQIN